MRFRAAPVLLALACWSCEDTQSLPPAAAVPVPHGPGDGVLFVGNSLTYGNDLPGLVQSLAAAVGRPVPTAMIAHPNFSLGDHLNHGDALRSIATGGWRVVVLQQGPTTLEDSRELLRKWTASFDQRIRAVGARTALFSVWAESSRKAAFADVAYSYSSAAQDVGGIYLPATQAWLEAWARDPLRPLYASDGFHPSPEGSYLAALVIAGVLTGVSPAAMPAHVVRPNGTEVSFPEETATVLRSAAAAAIASSARY